MDVRPGRYRHYKGKDYEVIGLALHSETNEKMVVYRALYKSEEFGENAIWVRPLSSFTETVEFEGKPVPRFTKIEPPT